MNKKNWGILIYVISSLILPTAFQYIFTAITDKNLGNPLINSAVFFLICITIPLMVMLIKKAITLHKTIDALEILRTIDRIGNQYTFMDGNVMFDIKEEDYNLLESMTSKENSFERKRKNSRIIIYHSTQVKDQINWIEFIFWRFLAQVKQEIKCDVIISLHYDEKDRSTGFQNDRDRNEYKRKFDYYSGVAKSLIGSDITVLNEEDFHIKKRDARLYAYSFHNKFVKCIIEYIDKIQSGEMDKRSFMRNLSYIESVFPVIALSKSKMKHSRMFILDRERAHEIWHRSPFLEYKNSYGLLFISAKTLCYPNGEPIRIFSHDETINLSDNVTTIKKKIQELDYSTKKLMIELMLHTSDKFNNMQFPIGVENIDESLFEVLIELKSIFAF